MPDRGFRALRGFGLVALLVAAAGVGSLRAETMAPEPAVRLRVPDLPQPRATSPHDAAMLRVVRAFQSRYPHIRLEAATPLRIEGTGADAATLMAIAGQTAPDILIVSFRRSQTYIQEGFLVPLDRYMAEWPAGELERRIPAPVRPVAHAPGPDGQTHWWMVPTQTYATVLLYRKDLFAAAGLDPRHPPRDWSELRAYARRIADPRRGIYGLSLPAGRDAGRMMYFYLAAAGVDILNEVAPREWRAAYNGPDAVDAFLYVRQLLDLRSGGANETGPVVYRGADAGLRWHMGQIAMNFGYLSDQELSQYDSRLIGVAPMPGPHGRGSTEINAHMLGIFAGQKDERVRRAAWQYISFLGSREAHRIYTEAMVEAGAASMMNPLWLREFGFAHLEKLVTPGLAEIYEESLRVGKPEPYERNAQMIYSYLSRPIESIAYADFSGLTGPEARSRIKETLDAAVAETNQKMLGVLPAAERAQRNAMALCVVIAVAASFAALVIKVFAWLHAAAPPTGDAGKSRWMPVWLLLPAVSLVLLWSYYPLFRGSLLAFQDYRILRESSWIGLSNFADVLHDPRFWLSLGNAFVFCGLWMALGFFPPVILAVLLDEIPRAKIFLRIVYYIPAVVSGVVILFMWRGIFDPSSSGVLNQILGFVGLPPQAWLQDPRLAMLCVVVPLAWANLGPGSIIYLAALRGIPQELYESAEIDGAGMVAKFRYVILSYLRPLLIINMVGAVIAGFKSGDAVLAMTGGGPNFATHVVGYEIWQRSFMFLQFGQATAMAWLLGVVLMSFTALQMRTLARVEFRTAKA